jgi:hypothetical protein
VLAIRSYEAGLRWHGLPGRVAHVVELLDESYSTGEWSRQIFHLLQISDGVRQWFGKFSNTSQRSGA